MDLKQDGGGGQGSEQGSVRTGAIAVMSIWVPLKNSNFLTS